MLTLGLICGATGVQAQPKVHQAQTGDRALHVTAFQHKIEVADGGQTLEFTLPDNSLVSHVTPTDKGWVATGRYGVVTGGELLLLEKGPAGVALLPPPPDRGAELRSNPVPFVVNGRFEGVAWLQGTRQKDLTVRAAAWDGRKWTTAELPSPAGPGAQLALQGTVLNDGSWLLVWAAVDGEDDEIYWSRRSFSKTRGAESESLWTPPARVHSDNDVPDILPAVVAIEDGAMVAWSAFDGTDYRIKLARFDGRSWAEMPFEGGRGATRAGFVRHGEGVSLVYRTVVPEAWHVADFDRKASMLRTAKLPGNRTDRPLLERSDEAKLIWPHQNYHWEPESKSALWLAEPR